LLEKSEFEPRISTARERLSRLEEERKRTADEESRESELRLVIGQLEEFARRVSEGLREPDWETKREIVRALVKQVGVDEGEIRIVYRVSLACSPFFGPLEMGVLSENLNTTTYTTVTALIDLASIAGSAELVRRRISQ
jgi:site-specific DNA recombinase